MSVGRFRRSDGWRSGGVALVIGLALLVPLASAARADAVESPGLQLSLDGVRYHDALAQPLFAGAPTVVPGDTLSVTLWVRNASTMPAEVRLSGRDAHSTSEVFADALLVSAGVAGSPAAPALPFGAAAECVLLFSGPVLQPGASLPLTVTVAFSSSAAGREGQDARAGLDFVAALRDPADGAGSTADCAGGAVVPAFEGPSPAGGVRGGEIASTGLPAVLLTMAAAVLFVGGVALLASRRPSRRRPGRERSEP